MSTQFTISPYIRMAALFGIGAIAFLAGAGAFVTANATWILEVFTWDQKERAMFLMVIVIAIVLGGSLEAVLSANKKDME